MAQKLHDQYGYNYDNLKVLLGGWNAWVDAGYPTETSGAPAGAPAGAPTDTGGKVIILTPGP